MNIFSAISDIFKPVADLVDNVHTSKEEIGLIKLELQKVELAMLTAGLKAQCQLVDATARVAVAEQQYGNFISKSWRPVSSLAFTCMLFAMSLDVIAFNQTLAYIGGAFLGVYGVGRSVEKKKL